MNQKAAVRQYWEQNPCGADKVRAEPYSTDYFREIEERRSELEPYIASFARFEEYRGREVLEVGVGTGTDFIRFARAGAIIYGVDLAQESVRHTRSRLQMEALTAKELQVGDCEDLDYPDDSFDLVYSWGVLHHTPSLSCAVSELVRVLRPGGELKLMLYHRHSITALWTWVRFALLRGRPWKSLSEVLASHVESPGTGALTVTELSRILDPLPLYDIQMKTVLSWCDRGLGSQSFFVRKLLGALSRMAGNRVGWFLLLQARCRP